MKKTEMKKPKKIAIPKKWRVAIETNKRLDRLDAFLSDLKEIDRTMKRMREKLASLKQLDLSEEIDSAAQEVVENAAEQAIDDFLLNVDRTIELSKTNPGVIRITIIGEEISKTIEVDLSEVLVQDKARMMKLVSNPFTATAWAQWLEDATEKMKEVSSIRDDDWKKLMKHRIVES
jgi:hypothetical protein